MFSRLCVQQGKTAIHRHVVNHLAHSRELNTFVDLLARNLEHVGDGVDVGERPLDAEYRRSEGPPHPRWPCSLFHILCCRYGGRLSPALLKARRCSAWRKIAGLQTAGVGRVQGLVGGRIEEKAAGGTQAVCRIFGQLNGFRSVRVDVKPILTHAGAQRPMGGETYGVVQIDALLIRRGRIVIGVRVWQPVSRVGVAQGAVDACCTDEQLRRGRWVNERIRLRSITGSADHQIVSDAES